MKKMIIVMIVAVALFAALFVGCKYIRGQILDGPGMVRDSADYPAKESVDSLNKAANSQDGRSFRMEREKENE